ncbi:hypothetical protein GCG54_00015367 [Colletotrichum gloeosporioides]|uniref:PD-(D/E)XK nuclease-like domain-containing protein n=1 Tax=Colletotrichum gloeosporioides TaxID=474922 RepID=A0A8H4CQ23_COLGL|nr:uncharacterized protein GCG54_00015367 [Colletotrichum gloeosporioides]KAF3807984.1 hypothetical protein GCG54_00015367 [Colletotrichum gloeosporioides]
MGQSSTPSPALGNAFDLDTDIVFAHTHVRIACIPLMCDSKAVRQWLLSIPEASKTPCDAHPPIPSSKRKRRNSQALTPPNSDHNDISSHPEATSSSVEVDRQDIGTTMADQDNPFTPTKRPRLVPTESNPDETPRAPVRPDDSVSCDGNKSVASSSRPSRSKSPTKQYGAAEISQNPIKFFPLASIQTIQNIDARPGLRELRDVHDVVTRFAKGREIIPTSDEETSRPDIMEAIDLMRNKLGGTTINHTPHFQLRNKPISLSIESKQRDASLDDAHLQIGTWHAAQWLYLDRLAQINGASLQGLPFLPGLIIQAEDWHFVASTREGKSTIVWTKKTVGSTAEPDGAYQVIRVIQYLAWWTETVYWPWFLSTILQIPAEGTEDNNAASTSNQLAPEGVEEGSVP